MKNISLIKKIDYINNNNNNSIIRCSLIYDNHLYYICTNNINKEVKNGYIVNNYNMNDIIQIPVIYAKRKNKNNDIKATEYFDNFKDLIKNKYCNIHGFNCSDYEGQNGTN